MLLASLRVAGASERSVFSSANTILWRSMHFDVMLCMSSVTRRSKELRLGALV